MKIFAPLLRYDYGDPKRGDSLEKIYFVPALSSCAEVRVFWLEEHGFPNDLESLQRALIEETERVDPDPIFLFEILKSPPVMVVICLQAVPSDEAAIK